MCAFQNELAQVVYTVTSQTVREPTARDNYLSRINKMLKQVNQDDAASAEDDKPEEQDEEMPDDLKSDEPILSGSVGVTAANPVALLLFSHCAPVVGNGATGHQHVQY